MKRLFVIALALSSCQRLPTGPADAYQHWTDQMIVRFGLPQVGIWPCPDHEETDGKYEVEIAAPTDECFKMQPSHRWRGTWLLGPDEHDEAFCPKGMVCPSQGQPGYILDWHRTPIGQTRWSERYYVDFIGRRTKYPQEILPSREPYIIVVDRLIVMKDLGALPQR